MNNKLLKMSQDISIEKATKYDVILSNLDVLSGMKTTLIYKDMELPESNPMYINNIAFCNLLPDVVKWHNKLAWYNPVIDVYEYGTTHLLSTCTYDIG